MIVDTWFTLGVYGLAVFRLTRLIVYDRITEPLRRPFLQEVEEVTNSGETEVYLVPKAGGIRGWIGELISCHWCTGIWCAAGFYLGGWFFSDLFSIIAAILAAAGLAAILETILQRLITEEQ